MIAVIIAAGVGVDWWDAHQSKLSAKPVEVLKLGDEPMRRLVEENEHLKTENALLNMQNDALRKQVDELNQKSAEAPRTDVVKEDKAAGG